ncbi:MAG: M48 family metallopeptidase [Puniceicoccales bacterium]|jgi:predicted metal-dependent hydrolase|nr:M48 family metallopeptidase [Puniceicoccales bacterium]
MPAVPRPLPPDIVIEEIPREDGCPPARVSVRIQASARSRRIRLRVPPVGPVVLQIPPHAGRDGAIRFLRSQHTWLLKALARREVVATRVGAPARAETLADFFAHHRRLSALGKSYPLEIGTTIGKRELIIWKRDTAPVVFRIPCGTDTETALRTATRHFAAEVLPARVAELAAQCGVQVGRVSIRDQRGRWGSCSGSGTLSLNWRLVLLPPELQDYVVHHELAHRREMNHSERFWDLLREWNPRNGWLDRALTRDWSWLTHLARDIP